MNTFSIVGSVTYVGMLLFLSLLTEDAKLLLACWSQHQTIPPAPPVAFFHRSNLVAGGRRGHRVVGHKGCPRAATWFLFLLLLPETPALCVAHTPEGPATTRSMVPSGQLISPVTGAGSERGPG